MPVNTLAKRVRVNGASPLVIYYDLSSGARVELSARTFGNWVDKTVNLIDDLGLAPGDAIALPLLADHPDHWMSLVWTWAAWQFGSTPQLDLSDAELVVYGPECERSQSVPTVACSLHPLGMGFPVPDGVMDYHDVLIQPDAHVVNDLPDLAWREGFELGFDELTAEPAQQRILVTAVSDPIGAVRALAKVLSSGSMVLVHGGSQRQWQEISDAEKITG